MITRNGRPAMRRIDIEDLPDGPLKDSCYALLAERRAERKDYRFHEWFAHRSEDQYAVAQHLLSL